MERKPRSERPPGAASSSFLSSRKYLVRQPLFPEVRTPSLEKENHSAVYTTSDLKEAVREKVSRVAGAAPDLQRFRGPDRDPEALTVSALDHEEPPTLRTPRRSAPCPTLEVQRLNLPLRPQLTSTVLHPTYTSRMRVRSRPSSSAAQPEARPETSYQSDYWSCAIPSSPPPSADRNSADWDPNTEYQALLDYSYPLNTAHHEGLGAQVWPTEANLQDSGVELDRLCSRIRSLDNLSEGSGSSLDPAGFWDSGLETQPGLSRSSYIRSSSLLPKSRTTGEDLCEEFWLLPDHLEELRSLARQVKEATSLMDGATPRSSSVPAVRDQHREQIQEVPEVWRTAEQEKLSSAPWRRQRQEVNGSLMEHIQIFCSHLQQLIQWLRTISEKKAGLTPPTLDLDSVRQSLAEYQVRLLCSWFQSCGSPWCLQSFQREVGLHEPLTSSLLKSGHLLLTCIGSMCPEIRDTLVLIEQQSSVVESQAQQLLSSILSAMDALTQPSGLEQRVKVDLDYSAV